jgi:hypothetical protein
MAVTTPSRGVATSSPVEALLRELVEGQRRIVQLLERDRRPSPLSRGDRTILARLLPAIGGALGSEEFTSRDLACHSASGLRLVLRRLSAKSIGRLLARADGVPIDGWLVERCGVEINVALWRVVAVSHR